MSSSIGDLLEDAPNPNRRRFAAAILLATAVYFLIMLFVSPASA